MKKFLFEILILGASLILLNILVILFFNFPRKDYFMMPEKRKYYILGDSHARNFYPIHREKEFNTYFSNFAYGSDTWLDIFRKLEFLNDYGFLEENEIVLIQLEPHMFTPYRDRMNNNDISLAYENRFSFQRFKYIPLSLEQEVLKKKYFLAKNKNEIPSKVCFEMDEANAQKMMKRLNQQFKENEENFLSELQIENFYQLLEYLKEQNINAQFISYPIHSSYKKFIKKYYQQPEYLEIIEKLEFSKIDLLEIFHDDSCKFKNQDHINGYGADLVFDFFITNQIPFEGANLQKIYK